MSTEAFRTGPAGPAHRAPGALLLCRARPDSVAPAAQLLRESMLLMRAGEGWSVLVPEGRPWLQGGEPVDRVLTGWATALAVGASWPVLALWWDADRAGYTLAVGFRRPVGYVWLGNGTPAGEDEAMRTFAARLGLDPESLDRLTKPASATDARARLRALLAVLTRAGVDLPTGLTPGATVDRLREAARAQPDARPVPSPGPLDNAVRTETGAVTHPRPDPWAYRSGQPVARLLALAEITAGLPLTAWGVRHRSAGWITAGALLLAHGMLGLTYELARPCD